MTEEQATELVEALEVHASAVAAVAHIGMGPVELEVMRQRASELLSRSRTELVSRLMQLARLDNVRR